MSEEMSDQHDLELLRGADPASGERVDAYLATGMSDRILSRLRVGDTGQGRGDRRRPLRRLVPAAVVVAVAAVVVAVAVLPTSDEVGGELAKLAATAYAQELEGAFEYVRWRYDFQSDNAIDREIQTWAGAEKRFERRSFSVDGRPDGRDAIYTSRESSVSCEAPPGRMPSCNEYVVGSGLGADELWFEAPDLPTAPDRLREALAEEIGSEYEQGVATPRPVDGKRRRGERLRPRRALRGAPPRHT